MLAMGAEPEIRPVYLADQPARNSDPWISKKPTSDEVPRGRAPTGTNPPENFRFVNADA